MSGIAIVLGVLVGLFVAIGGALIARFYSGRRRAEQVWAASSSPKLKSVGTVKRFSILPLVDWHTARDDLVGEAGVSYLIRADGTTILFDVGYNGDGEHPSPLLRNMTALGVNPADIDVIVISHAHLDHLGGMSHQKQHTFGLSGQPVDLGGIPAYVPEPLSSPTTRAIVVDNEPQVIAPGIVSTGTIPRQLFFFGWTPEQSLAINVEGKGIVLVVGCGHSTLQRIIDRAEMLFDEPIYGIVGGLHYPATASRVVKAGLPMQRLLGTGKWPWNPIDQDDVEAAIAYLTPRSPKLVALSPHDSCDWSLNAFRTAFGEAYQDVLVGKEIVIQ